MLAYLASKSQFILDAPTIENKVRDAVKLNLKIDVSRQEYESWRNSLGNAMSHVMGDPRIPDDAGIAIEYRLNGRRFRIDFLISGKDSNGAESLVIIELKQWTDIHVSELADHVRTFIGGGLRDTQHPSYQAWSYARHLSDFNEYVYESGMKVHALAYLHNCVSGDVVRGKQYSHLLSEAPVFISGEVSDVKDSISEHIKNGSGTEILKRIEAAPIRPSKPLAEAVGSMLKGIAEFVLVDEQKSILEKILTAATRSQVEKKQVLIIHGGPGTGKSVVAINAMARLTALRKNVRYVTPNAAPRAVFEAKLEDALPAGSIRSLFSGSASYVGTPTDTFDVLIIDEAHRLKLRSQYAKGGVNQISEVINAARTCVFFIDEDQRVTWQDIGEVEAIESFAISSGAEVEHLELTSQFRCGGSDDYLVWLDNALGIREDDLSYFTTRNFDFQIFDDPSDLHNKIRELNEKNNRSRMVAGYCWDWVSRKDRNNHDIVFPGFRYEADWNLTSHGSKWIIEPDSVREVGCIHTCQGLELDYVGVIIGPDIVWRDGVVQTDPLARAKSDRSLHGYKKACSIDKVAADRKASDIIRNTYRTLLSRGMKGCYVYIADAESAAYFRKILESR